MKIHIKTRTFSKDIAFKGKTVADLFKQLEFMDEDYVTTKDGKIVLWDEKLKDSDILKLYSATSG